MRVAVVLTVLSMLRVALKKTFLHLGVPPVVVVELGFRA